jgi:UDP-N-acetylmuramoylalanine--D-glutamate ligase
MTTLVFGLGVAGEAVARSLGGRGEAMMLGDDRILDVHRELAGSLGVPIADMSGEEQMRNVLRSCSRLVPAPGVPETHPVFSIAREEDVEVLSEIELAYQWEQVRLPAPRPMVGITGTDGKTTTTLMARAILRQAGLRAEAVGNTDVPLVAALDTEADAFAVECSSFRLANTTRFRCVASAWLNVAPDHLDWHSDFDSYFGAKAKMWANLRAGDVAVAPVDDPRIVRVAAQSAGRVVTFGIERGDYHAQEGVLTSPHGSIVSTREMSRSMPHDITNALAAAAVCLEAALATTDDVARALRHFTHSPHRIELIGERGGVRWYNDSKATSPHAALVAIRAFDSVVLVAGGRNKGLDLTAMASEPSRLRAVVAIGESARDIVRAFEGICPVRSVDSMTEAVAAAAAVASAGDVVLLSPGCTSFDWYANYSERGDDFRARVRKHLDKQVSLEGQ